MHRLRQSIYDAEEEVSALPPGKQSPQVAATIKAGYQNVIELKQKTPPDVLDYIRDKAQQQLCQYRQCRRCCSLQL